MSSGYISAYVRMLPISQAFTSAWAGHHGTWLQNHILLPAKNPSEFALSANIKLPGREETDEVTQAALDKISDTLFDWYLESLRLLASKERASKPNFLLPSEVRYRHSRLRLRFLWRNGTQLGIPNFADMF